MRHLLILRITRARTRPDPKSGRARLGQPANRALLPVARYENVPLTAVFPSGRHPNGMLPRRYFPFPRFPYVRIAIPAVIPAHPDMVRTRSGRSVLHFQRGWPQFHHNIGGTYSTDA